MASLTVAHVITGLETGGAELVLARLVAGLRESGVESVVIPLGPVGWVADHVRAAGGHVQPLGVRPGPSAALAVQRLRGMLADIRPTVVQTWLYHADLIGGLAARSLSLPTIWNIRQSNLDRVRSKRSTRMVMRTCAAMSRVIPDHIVFVSETARSMHAQYGYRVDPGSVIPNGFDLERFRPDPTQRELLRAHLGVALHRVLVGHVGRWDPQKDHATLLDAFRLLVSSVDADLVMCGRDVDGDNHELADLIANRGLDSRVHMLGDVERVENVICALDVLASSSAFGEGLPNAVAEAMACDVPCVVTDSGDSAMLVGNTGAVVPCRDPESMARALAATITERSNGTGPLGATAPRSRVEAHYSLERMVESYHSLYLQLADLRS